MSKLDKIKTQIDFLKSIILTLIIGLFGMVSYLVINLEKVSTNQAIITFIGIVIDLIVLFIFSRFTIKKLNELEDL